MSERAKKINAKLKISSARNEGTRVVVLLRYADSPHTIEEK
jgi:nitrate/nitrite-specific signal transduction histidine kinase